uniref:Uncharacterized protein n=1 Tax=Marseillevirus LCMAC201 TaxID=2506605 RepID=A0A481YYW2_9VIRU|nr:MAG: hypothetical protein LCMAC201_05590 [Marseillevirus LCMAC201]
MKFTWHLLVIIAAVLIGACMFQKGEKNVDMSDSQLKDADMYRNYSYMLFAVAIAVAVYYYYVQNYVKAHMDGYNNNQANSYNNNNQANNSYNNNNKANSHNNNNKANMCGAKAYMPTF